MSGGEVTDGGVLLRFEIAPGRFPQVENVVEALTAWADVLRATADVVDPGVSVRIEIAGVEEGSQIFTFLLRKAEQFLTDVKAGSAEYPEISKALIYLGTLVIGSAVGLGVNIALSPEAKLPKDQMEVLEGIKDDLATSVALQRSQQKFFGVLQSEPAYDRIQVLNGDRRIIHDIPRSEFAERSGLWSSDTLELESATQKRTDTWDVVVIKPVLVPQERMWRVAKDGFEFSALMQDKALLDAIHDKTLPMRMEEGAMMKVEIEYRESYNGSVWTRDTRSYKIKRVLVPDLSFAIKPRFAPDIP